MTQWRSVIFMITVAGKPPPTAGSRDSAWKQHWSATAADVLKTAAFCVCDQKRANNDTSDRYQQRDWLHEQLAKAATSNAASSRSTFISIQLFF